MPYYEAANGAGEFGFYMPLMCRSPFGQELSFTKGRLQARWRRQNSNSDPVNQAFVRIYADCQDADDAKRLAQALELVLSPYEPIAAATPARYWKIPELFGFTYRLSSPVHDIWTDLLSDEEGWLQTVDEHDRSAVWNRRGDRRFLIAEVRWAELQTRAQ